MRSPYLLLALANFFWSLNFIIAKLVVDVIPPVTVTFLRWGLPAALYLYFFWDNLKRTGQVYKKHWLLLLFLGATGYSLSAITVYEAVRFTSMINTSFINAFAPVMIALTGFLMYRYPITGIQSGGFLLALFGVIWIVFKGKLELILTLQANIGDIIMVFNVIVWALHTIVYKRYALLFPSDSLFTMLMVTGVVATVPLMVAEILIVGTQWIGAVEARHLFGVLCLSIFPSVLAYRFWNLALNRIPANQVAVSQYLIPVYTVIISWLFLDERLEQFQIIGGAFIFLGVLLVTYRRT